MGLLVLTPLPSESHSVLLWSSSTALQTEDAVTSRTVPDSGEPGKERSMLPKSTYAGEETFALRFALVRVVQNYATLQIGARLVNSLVLEYVQIPETNTITGIA
jgi:hypothetical protein